ncbi:MAG: class I SAM-dependent methyltransferase [Hyphomonadaceae bacterium]
MDNRFVGRLYRRIVHKYFVNDLMLELKQRAKQETADYIAPHLKTAMLFNDRYAQLDYAVKLAMQAHPDGLVCEFGVAGGKTLRHIAKQWSGRVHGFDSFEGLPENWTGTSEQAGKFKQGKRPDVPGNAILHAGWFDKSVPPFLAEHAGPAALLHLDADLYSSTKTVLTLFKDRIVPGTVIVFDEYYNYPNWREHEFKAFQEFIAESGKRYRYIGFSMLQGQASVQIE